MKAKSTIDATEMPYKSNPIDLLEPSYNSFLVIASEYLKLIAITIGTYLILGIPAILALNSIRPITRYTTPSPAAVGLILLSAILISAAGIYLSYGFIKISLAAARGAKLSWQASLPKSYKDAWAVAWTSLLSGLIITLGLIALIIPGIIFAIRYSQVQYVVIDEGLTGMAALRRSQELVDKRKMDLVGLFSLSQVVGIVKGIPIIGVIFLVAYSLVTAPIMAIRYIQLTQLSTDERSSIPTNKLNYVLLILAIFVTIITSSAKK
jgi:hypothetical protein